MVRAILHIPSAASLTSWRALTFASRLPAKYPERDTISRYGVEADVATSSGAAFGNCATSFSQSFTARERNGAQVK
jgi:hypothetical protein